MKNDIKKMRDIKGSHQIINDPLFGELRYHNQDKIYDSTFSKEDYICDLPFTYVEISARGEARVCCSSWNPVVIGNVLEEDIFDIWSGPKVNIIRNTIIDGSYKYCDEKVCPQLRSSIYLKSKKGFVNPLDVLPSRIMFVVDHSCNLACPSCRKVPIIHAGDERADSSFKILNSVTESIFKEPNDRIITLGFDGAGEVFHSAAYRKYFETNKIFSNIEDWPNLSFHIQSNGTVLTEKIQKKYFNWLKRINIMSLSVDAGDKESYEKVRVNGDWDLLWKNIDLFYDSIMQYKKTEWTFNVIVQDHNFRSIPKLLDICSKYKNNYPVIKLSRILNWGTFTNDEYLKKAVWMPTHPDYQELRAIVELPEFKNYHKNFRRIVNFI